MEPVKEARAAWVYKSSFETDAMAEAYIRPMAEAGLNVIYASAQGDAAGNRFIDAAHKLGIEFHAIASGVGLPPDRADLAMVMPGGRTACSLARSQGAGCPSNPEVRRHNIDSIISLAKRAPAIDGVHIDWIGFDSDTYHGTVSLSYCYCSRCCEEFMEKHGVDPLELVRDTAARPDVWAQWVRYRCDVVNAYAAEIRSAVKSVRSDLLLSATAHQSDGAPDILHEPYVCSPNFQEWGRWMAEGTMDFFCPMPYTVDNASFRGMLETVVGAQSKADGRSFAYPGIGLPYLLDSEHLRSQIDLCRRYGLAGFSLFHADSAVGGDENWWGVVAELCSVAAEPPHRAARTT